MKASKKASFLRGLCSRPPVLISLLLILLFVCMALFAPWIAPYKPEAIDLKARLQGCSPEHLLGTDLLGRDTFSRIVYGSQTALLIAVVSILIGGVAGMLLGMLAGYFGGFVDAVIMRVTDALMAIPQIVLALALGVALGQSTLNLMVALGISSVPAYIRMMRGQTLSVKEQMYVTAAKVTGLKTIRLMLTHIVPNCLSPLIVTATINLGGAIMAEASLSFLGVGIAPPTPAWGSMVSAGFAYLNTNPLLSIAPGVAIMLIVLAFNILGDGLRDMLDPRIRSNV